MGAHRTEEQYGKGTGPWNELFLGEKELAFIVAGRDTLRCTNWESIRRWEYGGPNPP